MNYSYENTNYITAKEFNELIINYANINNIDYHDIPRGKGKKLTAFQRIIKTGYEYLNKLIEYEEKKGYVEKKGILIIKQIKIQQQWF